MTASVGEGVWRMEPLLTFYESVNDVTTMETRMEALYKEAENRTTILAMYTTLGMYPKDCLTIAMPAHPCLLLLC